MLIEAHFEAGHNCRLCGGTVLEQFQLDILKKHRCSYYKCAACNSLQTQAPHWLDEAYESSLSRYDTGAAQRNLMNLAVSFLVARLLSLRHVIDYGGGDGLLCRLLRDYGINCYTEDKYASPIYALAFTKPDFSQPDMVLAFEVVEHFVNPATDLDALFGHRPAVLLISTCPYSDETKNWWYLAPESGQHVFFYSVKALGRIAERYGYTLINRNTYFLFVRNRAVPKWKMGLMRAALRGRVIRFVKVLLSLMSAQGFLADFDELRKRAR